MSDLTQKVAKRFVGAAAANDLLLAMEEVILFHERVLQPWGDKFGSVLNRAQKESRDLGPGWVWQDAFKAYFRQWDSKLVKRLQDLDGDVEEVWLQTDHLDDVVRIVRAATSEPRGDGRISHAIRDFAFHPRGTTGEDHIAYRVDTLKEWNEAFKAWSRKSVADLKKQKRKLLQQ